MGSLHRREGPQKKKIERKKYNAIKRLENTDEKENAGIERCAGEVREK